MQRRSLSSHQRNCAGRQPGNASQIWSSNITCIASLVLRWLRFASTIRFKGHVGLGLVAEIPRMVRARRAMALHLLQFGASPACFTLPVG